jgi:hypothetical protein
MLAKQRLLGVGVESFTMSRFLAMAAETHFLAAIVCFFGF